MNAKSLEVNCPNELAAFGMLVNAMGRKKGGDGDTGSIFPMSDVNDLADGAQSIPNAVTEARRAGKKVTFIKAGLYWVMPDGSQVK